MGPRPIATTEVPKRSPSSGKPTKRFYPAMSSGRCPVPPAGADGGLLRTRFTSALLPGHSQDSPCATSVDSASRPLGIPDQRRSSADDNRSGVGSGKQAGCKPVVADDKEKAEKLADSSGNGGPSSGDSRRKIE